MDHYGSFFCSLILPVGNNSALNINTLSVIDHAMLSVNTAGACLINKVLPIILVAVGFAKNNDWLKDHIQEVYFHSIQSFTNYKTPCAKVKICDP
jgi:hypothetical protein